MDFDVIIIGGGPAGTSAGIYTARGGLSTLIIAKDIGALKNAEKIENFYGFPEVISGTELALRGRAQAERLGVRILEDEAFLVDELESGFSVECGNGIYTARAVVLATGKLRKKPVIQGLADYESRGVSYCATCDGAFYRNKRIAVLGSGSYARREAGALGAYSEHITILTNDDKAMFDTAYKVDTRKIAGVLGENKLTGVRFSDGEEMPLDALFIAVGTAGTSDFVKRLGLEERDGSIKIDHFGTTNVPGLFAAGDCTGGLLQIAKAAAEGAAAGSTVIDYLKVQRVY